MLSLLKFALILIEWAIQLKRRDEYEKKQERLREAHDNPAKYLRQFGRVQYVEPDESTDTVHDSGTSTDKHNSQ